MENTSTPRAAMSALAPTRLDLIARGGVASPAYLDVDATLWRARRMLGESSGIARPAPIAAYRALATRCAAHAEQLFRDHVREVVTRLPSGLTIALPTWVSDGQRLTYRLLLTYARQAEERIAMLVRGQRHPSFQKNIRAARAEHGLRPTSSDMSRVHGRRIA